MRDYTETRYAGQILSHKSPRVARVEATRKGLDTRYVVTSMTTVTAKRLYESIYCARGQAENLIKRHKSQLASDRTSCRSPLANQMRLILHTAAYWLMLAVRNAIPKSEALAIAEFATIRLRLLKLGARIIETAARVRIAFAAACPEAALFRHIATALIPAEPQITGPWRPESQSRQPPAPASHPTPGGAIDATTIAPSTNTTALQRFLYRSL